MKFFVVPCLLGLLSLFAKAADQRPPNIIIIFMDDMGYGDLGCFGATGQKTPHLDRMAGEGMKLTSFYAAPACSVSRAQLLTGCYGPRVNVPWVYMPVSAEGLNPKEITIADHLKQKGYATACIGKWHLGDQPEFLPTRQGFDHYFGIPYSNDMQRKSTENGELVHPVLRDEKVAELITDDRQTSITERYTREALKFISDNTDKPFFLYLPHTAIHTPIFPGKDFQGKSGNGRVGDWIEEVDASTGRILDALRESGIADDTLVIFTSDNGPWLVKREDSGSAGPLRGGKGSTWEGGMRVPTIAWWPGKITAGSVVDVVAGTIDLLPTAVTLAGGTVPAEPVIDGRDISDILLGKSKTSPREAHYYFKSYALEAVRQGPWKLAIASQNLSMGFNTETDSNTNPRLYHLDEDIGEKTNLAAEHPEIVAKLTALAEKMKAEIGKPNSLASRPAGRVGEPQPLFPSEGRKKAK